MTEKKRTLTDVLNMPLRAVLEELRSPVGRGEVEKIISRAALLSAIIEGIAHAPITIPAGGSRMRVMITDAVIDVVCDELHREGWVVEE